MEMEDATKIFQQYYQSWANNPERNKNGYEYEKSFAEMMQKVEQEVFQTSVGEVPVNKNIKKKYKQPLGK